VILFRISYLWLVLVPVLAPAAEKSPELPRLFVDTTYVVPQGRVHTVRGEGDFQAALDAAKPGDVITLEAGETFTGPFSLPEKKGSGWTVIRSSADGKLPAPGQRVDPSYEPFMPKLVAADGPVITAEPKAHNYRFIGIEIRPGGKTGLSGRSIVRSIQRWIRGNDAVAATRYSNQTLVLLGSNERSVKKQPHHLIFERCYLDGGPDGARRGIALNSRHTAVVDSYLSNFKTVGEDSQAIAGWNGAGPFKIVNNYLEGAGENIIFGGGDPSVPELVPADIEIRANHFAKPLSWRIGDPAYQGTPWTVKNLLELKNARRVLIDGNFFEYSWEQAQDGFAVLFTVRNQDGAAPWSVVEDVTFTRNVLRHVGGGINILGHDDIHPSRQTRRILIRNNLFYDVGGVWGGGRLFQLLDATADVVIEHNTAWQTDSMVMGGDHRGHAGFVFVNNIAAHNEYGIIGSGFGVGDPSLKRFFPGSTVRHNVIVGGPARLYPRGNFFPRSFADVGFIDPQRGDYRLKNASTYKRAADGTDIGVDFNALCAAQAGVKQNTTPPFLSCSNS
jgi:hypothetical protein